MTQQPLDDAVAKLFAEHAVDDVLSAVDRFVATIRDDIERKLNSLTKAQLLVLVAINSGYGHGHNKRIVAKLIGLRLVEAREADDSSTVSYKMPRLAHGTFYEWCVKRHNKAQKKRDEAIERSSAKEIA